jgi:biopolymer transport protein ExbD
MATMQHAAKAEPNLTPLLDMVFQLITFFMLVINFKSAALDLSLQLPVIGSARPVEGEDNLMILNINKDGDLRTTCAEKNIEAYIAREAQADFLAAHAKNPKMLFGEDLPVMVVIRADRATPFSKLNRVIKACQAKGYRKFAMKAMSHGPSKTS